nr:MAG TPA: hypothetical protein [Caudoviricetes sp.]
MDMSIMARCTFINERLSTILSTFFRNRWT